MKMELINKAYTEIINEWLRKGYYVNTASMNGSQINEIAHIDLTNGIEIIRILLARFFFNEGHYYKYSGIEIIVGRCEDNVTPNGCDTFSTIWNHCLNVVYCQKFYEIGRNRRTGQIWYGTKEQSTEQQTKWQNRYELQKARNVELGENTKKSILNYIRRQRGCKTVKVSDFKMYRLIGELYDYKIVVKGKNLFIKLHKYI